MWLHLAPLAVTPLALLCVSCSSATPVPDSRPQRDPPSAAQAAPAQTATAQPDDKLGRESTPGAAESKAAIAKELRLVAATREIVAADERGEEPSMEAVQEFAEAAFAVFGDARAPGDAGRIALQRLTDELTPLVRKHDPALAVRLENLDARQRCQGRRIEARSTLAALHVAQETYFAENARYASDFEALDFSGILALTKHHRYSIELRESGYLARAEGVGAMQGDLWTVTDAFDLTSVRDVCPPPPHRPKPVAD